MLGLSLVLSGIIYFFASNWPQLDRFTKITVSILLMLLFYGVSYVVQRLTPNHPFLSRWLLVSGSVTFGISIALLGQIYNSHADSYTLFVIWLIPVLLFSFLTKYQPFYVFSYILFHLAYWFFLNPSSIHIERTASDQMSLYLLIAMINLFIFIFTYSKLLKSSVLTFLSMIAFHLILTFISMFGENTLFIFQYDAFYLINFLYISLLIASIYYFSKVKFRKIILIASILFASALFLEKFFSFLGNFGEYGYVLISFFATAGLIISSIYFLRWLTKKLKTIDIQNKQYKRILFLKKAAITFVTIVASIMGIGAIISLAGIIFGSPNEPFFYTLGIMFISSFFFIKKDVPTIKYTFLTMGVIMATYASFSINELFFVLLLIAYGYLLKIAPNHLLKVGFYSLINLMVTIKASDVLNYDIEYYLIFFSVINLLIYYLPVINHIIRKNGLLLSLLSLFALTFFNDHFELHLIYNIGFLGFTTFFLYSTHKQEQLFERNLTLIMWFLFIGIKYYDLAWDLLHKSVLMVLLGVIFLLIAHFLDKKVDHNEQIFSAKFHWKPILLIIILQFSILSIQVIKSETILRQGETVKLELQPLDPRSLMQGDYVILAYQIANFKIEEAKSGERVQLVLQKNENDVHTYTGYYYYHNKWNKDYQYKQGDVIITGNYNGYDRIHFGIESYFVPEGTGLEVQQNAKFAMVKVGKNGNAILTGLAEK